MHGSAHAKRLPEGLVQVALSETWRTSEQSCYAWMTARFGNRPRTATGNYRYCRISLRGGAICRLIRFIRWFGTKQPNASRQRRLRDTALASTLGRQTAMKPTGGPVFIS